MIKFRNFLPMYFKYPLVRQHEQSDCGPAALLSVLRYFGGNDHLVRIRELCRTGPQGTTLYDLIQAAVKLGLCATGATGKYEDLMKETMPAIAHVVLDNQREHFIVIYKIDNCGITAGDPARGRIKIRRHVFEAMWKSRVVLLFTAGEKIASSSSLSGYKWLLTYLKRESVWIYQSLFLGLVFTFLGLLTAFFIQRLIDEFIPVGLIKKILYTGGLLIFLLFIRALAGYLREQFLIILNKRLSITLNADFIRHLFRLPKRFFDSRRKGDITARIHDIIKIQQFILRLSSSTLIDLMVILGSLGFIFFFSTEIGFIILLCLPVYTMLQLFHTGPIRREQQEVMKGFARVESVYIDSLNGIDEILSYCAADSFSKINKLTFGLFQDKIFNLSSIRNRLSLFSEISGSIIIVTVLITGALAVGNGSLLLGEMIATYSLLSYLIPAINRSVDTNISLQGAMIAFGRLLELILVEEERDTGNKSFELKKELKLKRIKFSWAANKVLFNGIDLRIPKGKIVSIWGPSGAGKSTLVQLIQRKYEPDEGIIILDSQKAEKICLQDYRKNITAVPQDIYIFNGTLAENIVLGRPTSLIELSDMARRYGFEKFFHRFGNGMNTLIGEEFRQLSGGERQLLGLARALLNQPSLLIIDECLNALDIELENMIFSVISRYARQQAVLIITHNIKIILKTDYLYILDKGQIIQEGAMDRILKDRGYFRSVVEKEWLASLPPIGQLVSADRGEDPIKSVCCSQDAEKPVP